MVNPKTEVPSADAHAFPAGIRASAAAVSNPHKSTITLSPPSAAAVLCAVREAKMPSQGTLDTIAAAPACDQPFPVSTVGSQPRLV